MQSRAALGTHGQLSGFVWTVSCFSAGRVRWWIHPSCRHEYLITGLMEEDD